MIHQKTEFVVEYFLYAIFRGLAEQGTGLANHGEKKRVGKFNNQET